MADDLKFRIAVDGADKAKDGIDNLSKSFGGITGAATLAIQKFNVLKGAATEIIGVVSDLAERAESTAAAYNAMSGTIDETVKRLNGAATTFDLVTAKNRAAQAGLQLTDHQFANLAVAGEAFGDALGIDAAQGVDQLASAVVSMNERSLRQFGIEVDSSKSRSENLAGVMAQLETRFGTASAAVDTAGGKLDQLKNKLKDAADGFLKGVTGSDSFNRALDLLIPNVGKASDDIGTKFEDMGIRVAAAFESIVRNVQSTKKLFDTFVLSPQFGKALDTFFDEIVQNEQRRGESIRGELAKREADKSARSQADRDLLRQQQMEALGFGEQEATKPGKTKTGGGGGRPANDQFGGVDVDAQIRKLKDMERAIGVDSQRDKLQVVRDEIAATLEANQAKLQGINAEHDARAEAFKAEQEIDAERKKMHRAQLDRIEAQGEKTREAAGIIGTAYMQAITGAQGFGEAIVQQLDAYLIKTAREQAIEALVNTAKGFAALLWHPAGAANFFTAAGINAAAAAAAGGASVAIPGGQGGSSSTSVVSTSPNAFGGGGGGPSGRESTYVINVQTLMPNADTGRVIQQSIKDANRKYGQAA
jgi:hypothetical protein